MLFFFFCSTYKQVRCNEIYLPLMPPYSTTISLYNVSAVKVVLPFCSRVLLSIVTHHLEVLVRLIMCGLRVSVKGEVSRRSGINGNR